MQKDSDYIILLLAIVSSLMLVMISFVISILYLYRRRQNVFEKLISDVNAEHDKMILSTKLEIQEETFQHISREIHDNITLSLTLAKLNLVTMSPPARKMHADKLRSSINLIGNSIHDLSDISRSLNSDIIIQYGLLKALEDELNRIRETKSFQVHWGVTGQTVFMNVQREVLIFRVIQEAFNNIIKHAQATISAINLHYGPEYLSISIADNGVGFDSMRKEVSVRAGLRNIETRMKMLEGALYIRSVPGKGTTISLTIPFNTNGN